MGEGASSLEAIGYRAWWNLPALPKFNTSTPAVRDFLWGVAEYWLKFGVDGWRLDVPVEIDDDSFWQEFRRRVKRVNPEAYIVGEIWHESQRWLQGDQFDAVMNYLLAGALLGFLMQDKLDDSMYKIGDYGRFLRPLDGVSFADRIDYLLGLYDPAVNQVQLNLLDSHDTPRFLTTAHGDKTALKLGWLFLFTFPGAPCLYYGDEIGLEGGPDPDCRKSFPWSEGSWDHDLLDYAKVLTALRHSQPALRKGSVTRLAASDRLYAFGRQLGRDRLVVALNASQNILTLDIPVASMGMRDGKLMPLFGQAEVQVKDGQIRALKVPARSGVVLKR
jgi:cyclomaltodextrinase